MSSKQLYPHQEAAIQRLLETQFETSVIQYATGTGKSLIGYELIAKYHELNTKTNIMWICEHKNVIQQQFAGGEYTFPKTLKIANYSNDKQKGWYDQVNSAYHVWKFSQLIVINRAFLTFGENYKRLKIPIGLIIHDECHTASNASSQALYGWLFNAYPQVKCIGLSATPDWSPPYNKLCIKYDMVDAILDKVICEPNIYSLKHNIPNNDTETVFNVLCELLNAQNAKRKIVIWCGTIDNCVKVLEDWNKYVLKYSKYVWAKNILAKEDHSRTHISTNAIQIFNSTESDIFLFCANKHREASDFKDIDGCVFMDGVQIREETLFVQCLGRVLRKNAHKNIGWMIDAHATNVVDLCERVLKYTEKNDKWKLVAEQITMAGVCLNKIHIRFTSPHQTNTQAQAPSPQLQTHIICANNVFCHFVRDYPDVPEYTHRISREIILMENKNVFKYIEYAKRIQQISEDTIYITRGSCGSSLVCYLLGITHVDPVKYGISFERFLHEGRETLPDIDFDFPYNKRAEIFMRMSMEWGEEISRISSKITWQERSATREAVRMLGNHKQMNNTQLDNYVKSLSPSQKAKMDENKTQLIGKQRTTMKHVGGVVFGYKNNLKKDTLINVTTDDKHDISSTKTFKIDILSSRSLAIIQECLPSFTNKHFIDIDETRNDIFEQIFGRGNNMGLVLAESVLMKRAFMRYKPRNIEQLAWCFAIVRPMAKVARDSVYGDNQDDECVSDIPSIVFDDDVIKYIMDIMSVSADMADNIRRNIAKGDRQTLENVIITIVNKYRTRYPSATKDAIAGYVESHVKLITRLTEYGFCKSHSVSYAMMIWHMARLKHDDPKEFWLACLRHADTSYHKWVHYSEAVSAGVDIREYITENTFAKSIFSQIRSNNQKENMSKMDEKQQLLNYGYWSGLEQGQYYGGCYLEPIPKTQKYRFRGILAAIRTPQSYKEKKQSGLYLGIGFGKYLDIIVKGMTHFDTKKYVGLEGVCSVYCVEEIIYITSSYILF